MTDRDSYFDPEFGLVIPAFNWVPAPRYLMRRSRVLANLPRAVTGERLLEVGCGSGAMLEDYKRLGYRCDAVEISQQALDMTRSVHRDDPRVTLHSELPDNCPSSFDALVSCEVLEHIEDDRAALTQWVETLKPGGLAILSAPSDPARFGANDISVGHFRRYTRASFSELCRAAGLEDLRFESYGYPLVRLTEVARSRLKAKHAQTSNAQEMRAATTQSGVERSQEQRLFPLMSSWLGRICFRTALQAQKLFLNREIGNGLLCIARKT